MLGSIMRSPRRLARGQPNPERGRFPWAKGIDAPSAARSPAARSVPDGRRSPGKRLPKHVPEPASHPGSGLLQRRGMEQRPAPGSEFAYGASLSAHGHVILLFARLSDELNAPKGKRRMQTLSRNPALFPPRRCLGAPGSRLAWSWFPVRRSAGTTPWSGLRVARTNVLHSLSGSRKQRSPWP